MNCLEYKKLQSVRHQLLLVRKDSKVKYYNKCNRDELQKIVEQNYEGLACYNPVFLYPFQNMGFTMCVDDSVTEAQLKQYQEYLELFKLSKGFQIIRRSTFFDKYQSQSTKLPFDLTHTRLAMVRGDGLTYYDEEIISGNEKSIVNKPFWLLYQEAVRGLKIPKNQNFPKIFNDGTFLNYLATDKGCSGVVLFLQNCFGCYLFVPFELTDNQISFLISYRNDLEHFSFQKIFWGGIDVLKEPNQIGNVKDFFQILKAPILEVFIQDDVEDENYVRKLFSDGEKLFDVLDK